MHPAASIIVFTAASGAGYGLLALLGALALAGRLPAERGFGAAALVLALALVSGGLLSSLWHLGHPERAWRALSQWRSSWLSREGVAALLVYPVAALFALLWLLPGANGSAHAALTPSLAAAAAALVALCALTVACTAMIYASLKPVRQWREPWVPFVYLALALATGSAWLNALGALFGRSGNLLPWIAVASVILAWALKLAYWRSIDRGASPSTAESATGLGGFGRVRLLDPPHTEANYLQREMGFRVARKHAAKLRRIALGAGLAAPPILVLAGLALGGGGGAVLAFLAALALSAAVLIERWLFFAEAKHTVSLYYGAESA